VKVRKVREGPAIQQVGFHILEWSLYLALGLRAMRAAGPWLPIAYALCRPRVEGPNRMDRQFRYPAFCTPILMHASPPLILGKSRMRKRACTDLCGGAISDGRPYRDIGHGNRTAGTGGPSVVWST
jgi:hypothetical protein